MVMIYKLIWGLETLTAINVTKKPSFVFSRSCRVFRFSLSLSLSPARSGNGLGLYRGRGKYESTPEVFFFNGDDLLLKYGNAPTVSHL